MNLEIPVVKDLKSCESVDNVIKNVIEEIKSQFPTHVTGVRSSNYYVELCLNPDFDSPFHRYSCTIYVQENSKYDYNRERDEESGDIYTVYDGINIELSWPSFGGVDVELCKDVLKLYTKVNDTCVELKGAYAHKLIRLSRTRDEEIKSEEERKLELNKRNVIAAITTHVSNMRVSNKFRTTSVVNGPSIDEGDYEVEINGKKFFCNVFRFEANFKRIA
jgi:hypothetical protein